MKKFFCVLLMFTIIAGFVMTVVAWDDYLMTAETIEYELSDMGDGVYGIYTVVSSRAPAHNYDMITLCCNGQVRTFKGNVYIHYIDNTYKLVLEDRNLVNGDSMYVYLPKGTVEYAQGIAVGK